MYNVVALLLMAKCEEGDRMEEKEKVPESQNYIHLKRNMTLLINYTF